MAINVADEFDAQAPADGDARLGQNQVNNMDRRGIDIDNPGNPRVDVHEPQNMPHDPLPEVPQLIRRRQHGYAMVEVHKTAARVIRWEFVDEEHEPGPADMLRQREWFQLGEWLARLPISDGQRAAYFEMERVSCCRYLDFDGFIG